MKNFFNRWRKTKIFTLLVICLVIVFALSLKVGCSLVSIPDSADKPQLPSAVAPDGLDGYLRTEESTYLTYPEWHIVYSSEEYANWLEKNSPSSFPYFSSIGQYWKSYCTVYGITSKQYGFNTGNHFMLWVIGTSFTVENLAKGVYENTVGRLFEQVSGSETAEEKFAYQMNRDYVTLIYDKPWYEFSFFSALKTLWLDTDIFGSNIFRKIERRGVLTVELVVKTVYGGFIKFGTRALYGIAPTEIYLRVTNIDNSVFIENTLVQKISTESDGSTIIKIPRYRLFTEIIPKLSSDGVEFVDIAGNDEIFLTIISEDDKKYIPTKADILFSMKILTNNGFSRIGMKVPVEFLTITLNEIKEEGFFVEHLYDY